MKIPKLFKLALLTVFFASTWITGSASSGLYPAAATYYVDQNHPLASNANPGSQSLPWLTIQHAAQVAVAGDTVIVKTGNYPERVVPAHSGSPGSPITFRAEPRRSVSMYGFYTVNANYLRIEGFDITTDPSSPDWTAIYGIFVRSNHVEVVDNYLHDIRSTAIQGYWHDPYPQAAYIADNTIYHSQMGIGITGYSWIVEDNEVERLYNYGSGDSDYSRFFGNDHIIRHNIFHGSLSNEIGSAHVDCFQTFDNNGEFGSNITVDGNYCSQFHQGFMGEAHYYHNISHITFKNNIFAHGWAWGLCVQDIPYLTAINNTFVDITHHGIGLQDDSHHAVIKNNIFYDTGTSYWFPANSSTVGDYNLIYNSQAPPVSGAHDRIAVDPLFVNYASGDFHLLSTSPAVDAGESLAQVDQDFDRVQRPQMHAWDIGAYEFLPGLIFQGVPSDRAIHLTWQVNVSIPDTGTWDISYIGPAGSPPSPITGLASSSRAFTIDSLSNGTWYTFTLTAMLESSPWLSATIQRMPTGQVIYLPVGLKSP